MFWGVSRSCPRPLASLLEDRQLAAYTCGGCDKQMDGLVTSPLSGLENMPSLIFVTQLLEAAMITALEAGIGDSRRRHHLAVDHVAD